MRLLRHGASPRRLAWSLAIGFVIGINPIIGSTTVIALAVAHLFKLNHTATQVGVHSAYPVQIVLLLPFLRAGSWLFRAAALPLQATELLALIHQHPFRIVRLLWTWEWHALVVWAIFAAATMPLLAMLLGRLLDRAMTPQAHVQAS